jgi:molybdopterin converting factor small subunit
MTKEMTLREYLKKEGVKDPSKYNIWVNGEKKELDYILQEDDEVIVLPILKGG